MRRSKQSRFESSFHLHNCCTSTKLPSQLVLLLLGLLASACGQELKSACTSDDSNAESVLSATTQDLQSKRRANAASRISLLEEEVAQKYTDLLANLSESDRSEEESFSTSLGVFGGSLSTEWSCRGTIRSTWAHRMQIPIPGEFHSSFEDAARSFLLQNGDLFGDPQIADSLVLKTSREKPNGEMVLRFSQSMNELPVFDSYLTIHIDPQNNISWLAGRLLPSEDAPPINTPMDIHDALSRVDGATGEATLGLLLPETAELGCGVALPVWRVVSETGPSSRYVFLDASTGEVLDTRIIVGESEHKEIFYYNGSYPGTLMYDDVCHTTGDAACPPKKCLGLMGTMHCYAAPPWLGTSLSVMGNANDVRDYYSSVHGRDGWDDGQCGTTGHVCTDSSLHRMLVVSDGHVNDCNASWSTLSGSNPAIIKVGTKYASCLGVLAHEFTHAVDEAEGNLASNDYDSGSLNESFPDVMGELCEAHVDGSADWQTATDRDASCDEGRDLGDPPSGEEFCLAALGDIPQPDHYSNFRMHCGSGHYNSTITSKSGYLMARDPAGGSITHWGIPVTGIGTDNTEDTWYELLTDYMSSGTTYTSFRNAAFSVCASRFSGSTYLNCIYAFESVGFWTADSSDLSWDTSDGISLAYFTVNSQPRRWIFYKDTSNSNIYYRYRTCTISGTCSWSSALLLDYANTGPSSSVFDGFLWTCFVNSYGSAIWCDRINSTGSKLLGPDPSGSSSSVEPDIAKFGSDLFLSFTSSGTIYWRKYNGSSWGTVSSTGAASSLPSVLASTSEDPFGSGTGLFLVYSRSSDNKICYRAFNTQSGTWDQERLVGLSDGYMTSSIAPAAAMHKGRLHVSSIAGNGTVMYASCGLPCDSADDWTRTNAIASAATSNVVHLDAFGAYDGRLYLWRADSGSSALCWRNKISQ